MLVQEYEIIISLTAKSGNQLNVYQQYLKEHGISDKKCQVSLSTKKVEGATVYFEVSILLPINEGETPQEAYQNFIAEHKITKGLLEPVKCF